MNVLSPTSALDVPADSAGTAGSNEWSRSAAEAPSRRGASPAQLVAAGIVGAVVASIAVVVILNVLPPRRVEDPRALAVSRDVEDLKAQFVTMSARMEEVDTSAVAAAEPVKSLSGTVNAQTVSLETLRRDVDGLTAASQRTGEEQAKIATPALLGMAVVQLRYAVDRGAPFDWELVNLWGIVGRRPDAAAELNRLKSLADGIPTQRQIVADLRSMVANANAGATAASRTVETIVWMLGGRPPGGALEADASVLARALALAERGDYAAGAKELRSAAPADTVNAAERMAVAMENRATAQAAMAKLMAIARDGLSSQLRMAVEHP